MHGVVLTNNVLSPKVKRIHLSRYNTVDAKALTNWKETRLNAGYDVNGKLVCLIFMYENAFN